MILRIEINAFMKVSHLKRTHKSCSIYTGWESNVCKACLKQQRFFMFDGKRDIEMNEPGVRNVESTALFKICIAK